MTKIRFKTQNLTRNKPKLQIVAQEELVEETVVSQEAVQQVSVENVAESNDTQMNVGFSSSILFNLVMSSSANFSTAVKYRILLESIFEPLRVDFKHFLLHFFIEVLNGSEQEVLDSKLKKPAYDDPIPVVPLKFFIKQNVFVNKFVQEVDAYFTKARQEQYIAEDQACELIRNVYKEHVIVVTNSTNFIILGEAKIFLNQKSIRLNSLFKGLRLPVLGNDALDTSKPGLTAGETYRLYLFNSENLQQINPTFETGLNVGQFGDKYIHTISGFTLGLAFNKF